MEKMSLFIKCIVFLVLAQLYSCQPADYSVKYIANGSATLTVNYVDAMGNSQQYLGPSPFEQNFTAKAGAELNISASCGPNGTSTVIIYVNDVDKAHDTETAIKSSVSITVK